MNRRTGILLVAFGASNRQAHDTLQLIDGRIRKAFPGVNVRIAFTSELIRDRLAAERVKTDSVRKALEKMWFEKYTKVAIQSLHVIPGAEYEDLLGDAALMRRDGNSEANTFEAVTVGRPLLDSEHDVAAAAKAVLAHLPVERAADEAVLFMGHGTWHAGEGRYAALNDAISAVDPLVMVGTMDGDLTIDAIIPLLKKRGVRHVWLLPFLSMVGRHAKKDMAGDAPDSWNTRLTKAGFACTAVLRGLAECDAFADIWLEHLAEAVQKLDD